MKRDWLPLLLVPVVADLALPLIGSPTSWVTLTVAGLAMGLMIFIMASGLTLTFGLMDVLNFGHGAFIAVGAFVAASVMLAMAPWMTADSLWLNLGAMAPAVLAAMAVSGALGWGFERVIVRPVYGQHLRQILVTTGGLIVAEQLLKVVWGPDQITLARPTALRGAFLLGDVAIEKYRVLAVLIGLAVFAALALTLNRTRLGLLIRAGVENGEMVEALGYRIRRLFIGVFVAGSALAGLGGAMWGLYQETVTAAIGAQVAVLIFIVIIVGGGWAVGGFLGAGLVGGVITNTVVFSAPEGRRCPILLLLALMLLGRAR